jgi:hypothetical protein
MPLCSEGVPVREDRVVDQRWAADWRVAVAVTVAGLMDTFQARFGFEPGVNQLGLPAAEEVLASLRRLGPRPASSPLTSTQPSRRSRNLGPWNPRPLARQPGHRHTQTLKIKIH